MVISYGLDISLCLFLHEHHTYPETVSIPLTSLTILTLVHYMSVLSISFCFCLLSVILCLRGEGDIVSGSPFFQIFIIQCRYLHQWCNGQRARLECGTSSVGSTVRIKPKDYKIDIFRVASRLSNRP